MQHLTDDSSIFTAESKAVDLALGFINTCDANNIFFIFSDSLSVLKAMNHTRLRNLFLKTNVTSFKEIGNKEIVLCWIPSHIDNLGNEIVIQQGKT